MPPLCENGRIDAAVQEVKRKPIVENFEDLKRTLNLMWEDVEQLGKILVPIMTPCAIPDDSPKKLATTTEDSDFARELRDAVTLANSIKGMIRDYNRRIEI